jgi:carbon monoxide dehydrogenase subunit G
MAVELNHTFSTTKPIDQSYETLLDLERTIPCVEGGRIVERTGPESARAEIVVSMGAMSLSYSGTVEIAEADPDAHRVVMTVTSKEAGGQGHANATVVFTAAEGGGTIHTVAQITGTAASMGEGIVTGVLDAMITDFASKLGSA